MKEVCYDVVVCGGGVAGVAAAVAAARRGAKTALVEKQCLLGGLATSGLIYVFLPLCDGYGHQVTFGLAEEMIRRCTEYGPFDVPEKWGGPAGGDPGIAGDRYQCCFSPAGFTLTLDRMLEESGVDLLLDTLIIDVRREGTRITAVETADISGRVLVNGKCFVDATGGAQLSRLAGARVLSEVNHNTPWLMEMASDHSFFPFTDSLHIRALGKHTPEYAAEPPFDGTAVTDFVRQAWRMIRSHYDRFDRKDRRGNYPVHLPAMPQIRKVARIDALYNLDDRDAGRTFDHAVGTAGDWNRPGPVWQAPYEALVPKELDGVLAAGRCIGAGGYAWEMFRVIPASALTGEAAGTAAALCAERGLSPKDLPFALLKEHLPALKA